MQVNGKLYKAAFTKSVYEFRVGHPVERSNKDFVAFKQEHQKAITARNLIRDLFLEVNALGHFVGCLFTYENHSLALLF